MDDNNGEVAAPFMVYLVDAASGRVICVSEDAATCEQVRTTGDHAPFDPADNIRISFAYGSEIW